MTSEKLDTAAEVVSQPILQRSDRVIINFCVQGFNTTRPEQAWYLALRGPDIVGLEGTFQGYMMDFTLDKLAVPEACAVQFADGSYVICDRYEITLVERATDVGEMPKLPD